MIPASVRPVITLAGGVVIGLLIAWGLFGRFSIGSPNSATTPNQVAVQPTASPTPSVAEETNVADVKPSPFASASPEAQITGLRSGVTQAALNYNKEIYSKYPGLQPPVINTDGRYLGTEALQRLQQPPTMLANPGGAPLVPATPAPLPSLAPSTLPFPLLNGSANPSPTASNQ